MVKGIAIVLLRVMGVTFCLSAIVTLPWTITFYGSMGDEAVQNIVYIVIMLTTGLGVIAFSRVLASLIAPGDIASSSEENVVSEEALVSAGTIILGIYLLITGLTNLIAPFLEFMEFLWVKTSMMARDHEEEFLEYGQSVLARYDYVIAGIAKVILAFIVILFHPRIAELARKKT